MSVVFEERTKVSPLDLRTADPDLKPGDRVAISYVTTFLKKDREITGYVLELRPPRIFMTPYNPGHALPLFPRISCVWYSSIKEYRKLGNGAA